MGDYKDKIVLITGASRGIGRSIALKFLDEGAYVIANYRTQSDSTINFFDSLKEKYGKRILPMQADISKEDEVKAMFSIIKKNFSKLDVLINNAGITHDAMALMMSVDNWDDVININLRGTFLCSKAALWMMCKVNRGVILNMASVSGCRAMAGQSNYASSKAGIIMLTKVLAKEYGKYNIRINSIAPGFVMTEMTEKLEKEIVDGYLSNIPLQRFGGVDEIAEIALFLCSDKSSYITGQCIEVDGGLGL